MYSIVNDITNPGETEKAITPKAELVLGDMEIGIGAFYQEDKVPSGMLTATTSFLEFNLFGEAVVSYGVDKRFIEETDVSPDYPLGLMAVDRDNEYFISGTLGFKYSNQDDFGNFLYYYNRAIPV